MPKLIFQKISGDQQGVWLDVVVVVCECPWLCFNLQTSMKYCVKDFLKNFFKKTSVFFKNYQRCYFLIFIGESWHFPSQSKVCSMYTKNILKYGSEEKGSWLYRCSPLLGFIMSKKQARLRSELLSEDKITNLLVFLT